MANNDCNSRLCMMRQHFITSNETGEGLEGFVDPESGVTSFGLDSNQFKLMPLVVPRAIQNSDREDF